MSDTLHFYTNPMSRGGIVRWMLEEVVQPYETHVVAYGPEMKSDAYLAINPMGKVPALVHGDRVVTECAAICAYLADAFPQAGLAPPLEDRAAYYRWLFFAAGPVEAAVTAKSLGWEPTEEQQRMAGFGNFAAVMDMLDYAVSAGDYLAGNRFTAADLYLGAHIGWGLQFGTVEARDSFKAYWARLSDRPAYQRAVEIDKALMPESPT
ncbi:MAG: glutathione S-transferase family protein [Pseudomonadota bacterium]